MRQTSDGLVSSVNGSNEPTALVHLRHYGWRQAVPSGLFYIYYYFPSESVQWTQSNVCRRAACLRPAHERKRHIARALHWRIGQPHVEYGMKRDDDILLALPIKRDVPARPARLFHHVALPSGGRELVVVICCKRHRYRGDVGRIGNGHR